MSDHVMNDVESETIQDDRSAYKRKTAELDQLVSESGIVCGIPVGMLVYQEGVILSPSFLKTIIEGMGGVVPEISQKTSLEGGEWTLHNTWFTKLPWRGKHGIVEIWRNKTTGKFQKKFKPLLQWQERFERISRTTAIVLTFGIEETEVKARQKLEAMLSSRQRRSLLLSDSFYETGKSGVLYWIRKNRPTIAVRMDTDSKKDGKGTPLCALCLHPLGWYRESYAGIMTPSDDMMTHLLMIRANEHYFWKKANQHSLDSLISGI